MPGCWKKVHLEETTCIASGLSGGDGRKLLNLLELVVPDRWHDTGLQSLTSWWKKWCTVAWQLMTRQERCTHDLVSAFIKSMRGSDPNAAMYYLARMLEGGEDQKFIARRMLILASEDIGNASPNALLLATSCFRL